MLYEIKHRYAGHVMFSREAVSMRACVIAARQSGCDLRDSDLRGSNLRGCNLRGCKLRDAKNFNPYITNPLMIFAHQPGPIYFAKLVTSKGVGPNYGHINYLEKMGERIECADADTDPFELCSKGLNVATFDWCLNNWQPGYRILLIECTAQDIACIPYASDGKLRLHRGTPVKEIAIEDLDIKAKKEGAP